MKEKFARCCRTVLKITLAVGGAGESAVDTCCLSSVRNTGRFAATKVAAHAGATPYVTHSAINTTPLQRQSLAWGVPLCQGEWDTRQEKWQAGPLNREGASRISGMPLHKGTCMQSGYFPRTVMKLMRWMSRASLLISGSSAPGRREVTTARPSTCRPGHPPVAGEGSVRSPQILWKKAGRPLCGPTYSPI